MLLLNTENLIERGLEDLPVRPIIMMGFSVQGPFAVHFSFACNGLLGPPFFSFVFHSSIHGRGGGATLND